MVSNHIIIIIFFFYVLKQEPKSNQNTGDIWMRWVIELYIHAQECQKYF